MFPQPHPAGSSHVITTSSVQVPQPPNGKVCPRAASVYKATPATCVGWGGILRVRAGVICVFAHAQCFVAGLAVRAALSPIDMSDSGSEDYSSSEDEDYVPSGGEYSEDDVNDLVKEDDDDDEEEKTEKPQQEKPKKKKAQCILARKRKKGGLVLNPEDGGEEKEGGAPSAEEDTAGGFAEEKQVMAEEVKKKKEDDLWSSFLSDVGQKAKTQPPATPNTQVGFSTQRS
ncbi:hypothetical protein FKM82_028921 [Ascaphus truei]